ncbi:hypothetical protein [Paenibacillus apiarius]|uniref:hypothetical protein n=1 Tax=Paenibacillus apiarius TaxID=46240 RepID=UPI003B3AC2E3
MAKVISDINLGRKITLELTEQELATVVYALGITKSEDLEREVAEYSFPCLEADEGYRFWESLEEILLSKGAV